MVKNAVKCNLKHSRSYFSVGIIYLFLIFFKISGMFTPSIEMSKHIDDNSLLMNFKPSRCGVVYNSLLLITWVISYALITVLSYFYRPAELVVFKNVIAQKISLSVIVSFAILLRYCARQRLVARIGNELTRLQRTFDLLRREPRRNSILGRLVAIVFLHLLLLALLPAIDYAHRGDVEAILRDAPDIVAIYFTGCCTLQYYLVVAYVDARLADVNDALNGALDARGHLVDEPALRIGPGPSRVARVVYLRDLYKRIFDLANLVDEFYSPPILFIVGNVSFRLTTDLFNSILYCTISPEKCHVYVMHSGLFVTYISLPIILLGFVTTSVRKRAEETANVVHNALNHTIIKELVAELKLFSLQLLHEKPHFTACGFFNVDCSMLQGIIQTVTTFLVILIQFQMATTP